MRITDKYIFFYKDWLSNYTLTDFYFPSAALPLWRFNTTEQAFMYMKAIYFRDYQIADEILHNGNQPNECRLLGRKVKNYNDAIWSKIRYNLFYLTNYQKYIQDKKLQDKLLDPKFDGKIFVEASPIDRIWGVGLSITDPLIDDEANWRGTNFLGQILTDVREKIKNKLLTEVRIK